jgi:flagellar biogenesis protein FliO
MYSAAPVVWLNIGALYRDLPYVQAPLTIFLNYGIMELFSPESIFFISRFLSMVLVLATVALSAFALRRTKDPEFVFLFVILCLSNPYILSNSAEMGSYAQPLFLVAAALAASTLGLRPWLIGVLVGVLLGLSVSAKLNFLFAFPAFLLLLLLKTEWSWRMIAWFGVGAFFGMLPLGYYAAMDFGSFFRRLVQFHYLTLEARGLDPIKSASQILTHLSALALAMVAPAAFLVVRLNSQPTKQERGTERLLAFAFLGCGVVMGIAARTVYAQYLAPLVLFLLFFSMPDRETPTERKRVLWIVGMTFFVIQFSALVVEVAQRVASEKGLAMWDAVKMQQRASLIAGTLGKCDKRLYSSQPLFLLSKDVKYPAELGTGPFLLALRGGKLKAQDIGVDIDARLAEWAPTLLIYGFYSGQNDNFGEVDDKIQHYGEERGFETVTLGSVTNRKIVIAYEKACV